MQWTEAGSSEWRLWALQGLRGVTVAQAAGLESSEAQNSMVFVIHFIEIVFIVLGCQQEDWSLFSLPSWHNQLLLIKRNHGKREENWT